MPRIAWQKPNDLSLATGERPDEFADDVSTAMSELRARHGLDGHSVAEPAVLDAFRRDARDLLAGVNRRGFLQLSGAAAVLALVGCYQKKPDTIVPYADQPDGSTVGKPLWYSTVIRDSGRPVPVMVKCYDGRPIKIEGNPDHPRTKGRCDAKTQAALLNLYDPDRLQDGPKRRDGTRLVDATWSALDTAVGASLKSGGVGLITGPIDGPATMALMQEFIGSFGDRCQHVAFTPWSQVQAPSHLAEAALLVIFGGDPLAEWPLADQVAFGAFRRLRGTGADVTCGQLIVVEGVLSQTGSVADLRVRCHPDVYATVAWGVAAALAQRLNKSIPADVASQLATIAAGNNLGAALGLKPIHGVDAIAFIAGRLAEVHAAGQRVVLAAGPACGAAVASATQQIAALLGDPDAAAAIPPSTDENLRKILARCAAGEISTLLIAGVNPAYLLGHDAAAMKALTTVKTLVVLDDRLTETALLGHFVAPTLHDLESWGDAGEDIASLQQPCIQPLWNARAWQESLLAFAVAAGHAPASFRQAKVAIKPEGQAVAVISRSALYQPATDGVQSWAAFVQAVWSGAVLAALKPAGDARSFWQAVLARGHVELPNSGRASENNSALPQTLAKQAANGFRLVLTPSRALGAEGRWLNNAWLQELPDPVSKITWDNYCALSPHDAMELGIRENDVVKISIDSSSVRLPVHVQEGQQPGVLESFLGWGRAKGSAGAVADLGIETGFSINLWPLAAQLGSPASVEKTGETWPLALAQGHQRMEGRAIALDDVLELHRRDPGKRQREHRVHAEPAISLNVSEHQTPGRKWGMAIDLSLCTGCNACVAACNAENNIPVVGRDEVRKGRLMHWLRIDRYYISENGDQLDVEAVHQPVMCQHCDHAPCEEVCPATATVHNDEGQNVMVYNRCIGTRYCSNNCPYKVRRFNWYEYSKYRLGPIGAGAPLLRIANNFRTTGATSAPAELAPMPLQMLLNPEVTVRSRGVMEKCSFCVQRTREVREHEKADGKRLPDGAITSACAQTCPTAAIVFGDLNDDTSAVSQAAAQGHGYKLLDEELNTRPAVTYLARIRNRPATTGEKGDP